MRLPNIVAIEGIDGAAKSTQAKLLADAIDAIPLRIIEERVGAEIKFHGGESRKPSLRAKFPAYETPIGIRIKEMLNEKWRVTNGDPISETLNAIVLQSLMTVNRLELADEIERACVVEGRTVVLDRFWASGVAYGAADGLDPKWLEAIHSRLPKAHHVFIDIPVEESFKRRPDRTDAYEASIERLKRARVEYLALFERHGVDTAYWNEELLGETAKFRLDGTPRFDFGYHTTGVWSIVNGLGTVEEVHERIRKALGL